MNNFQKTLLTAALAWACIVIPNIAWQALGRSLLWDLSYVLPPAFVGPVVLLVAAFWVALFAWKIWRLWKTNGLKNSLTPMGNLAKLL